MTNVNTPQGGHMCSPQEPHLKFGTKMDQAGLELGWIPGVRGCVISRVILFPVILLLALLSDRLLLLFLF